MFSYLDNQSYQVVNQTRLNITVYFIPCNTDYDEVPVEEAREAELSEDTDCDGSSLPEDSPEVQITPYFRYNQACVGSILILILILQ